MKRDQRQLELDLEVPTGPARKRRVRAAPRSGRNAAAQTPGRSGEIAMMDEPELSTCGFCGRRLTVHSQVTVCPGCGGIVSRPDEED